MSPPRLNPSCRRPYVAGLSSLQDKGSGTRGTAGPLDTVDTQALWQVCHGGPRKLQVGTQLVDWPGARGGLQLPVSIRENGDLHAGGL